MMIYKMLAIQLCCVIMNKRGPSIALCEAPLFIGKTFDFMSSFFTHNVLIF